MIKTFRRNPLVFHFISDENAKKVLSHLVTTWRLQHVDFRFYAAEPVLADVAWIPNKHYSGVYGLLKLTLPKILPDWLDRDTLEIFTICTVLSFVYGLSF